MNITKVKYEKLFPTGAYLNEKIGFEAEIGSIAMPSEEMMKLAASLTGEKYKKNTFSSFFSNLFPTRQDINREIFYKNVFK